jgi:hypothetical protein
MGAAGVGLSRAGGAGLITFAETSEMVFGLFVLVNDQAGIAGGLTSKRGLGAGSGLGSLMEREFKMALPKSIDFLKDLPIPLPRAAKTPRARKPIFLTVTESLSHNRGAAFWLPIGVVIQPPVGVLLRPPKGVVSLLPSLVELLIIL